MLRIQSLLLLSCLIAVSSCSSFSDPALRLAQCLDRGAERLMESEEEELVINCDLQLDGSFIVVLHPRGEYEGNDYVRAGLGKVTAQLQSLRLGSNQAVYVIPLESQAKPSRTSALSSLVSLPQLLVASCSDSVVALTLRLTEEGIQVVSIE